MNKAVRTCVERFVKPAVPILIVLSLLACIQQDPDAGELATIALFHICGLILFVGWSWVRRNIVTKIVGVLLAIYLSIVPAIVIVGIALASGLVLFLVLFIAAPWLVYDLFFRQPRKGRFMRARAARRGLPL